MRWLAGTLLFAFLLHTAGASAQSSRRGGRTLYAPCNLCHSFTPNRNGWGPSLAGIFSRKSGIVPGFIYSPAMRERSAAGLVWSEANLDAFLKNPADFIPGSFMRFPGYPKAEDRRKVIAYLKCRSTPR